MNLVAMAACADAGRLSIKDLAVLELAMEPKPFNKISKTMGHSAQWLTTVVSKLVSLGLVFETRSTHDRRVRMLVTTNAGADALQEIRKAAAKAPAAKLQTQTA